MVHRVLVAAVEIEAIKVHKVESVLPAHRVLVVRRALR